MQCQHVTNGLGRAVELPGHRAERLSVFDESVQRRDVDGVGIGAGQHQPVEESQRWLPGQWFGDTSAVQELLRGSLQRLGGHGCQAGRVGGYRSGEDRVVEVPRCVSHGIAGQHRVQVTLSEVQ